jgi:butyrate kinase
VNYRVLVVNPGSTSTKVALFEGGTPVFERDVRHDKDELDRFGSVAEQHEFRLRTVLNVLDEESVDLESLDAVAGRGGLTAPLPGGAYEVNRAMLEDLAAARHGEHPCNLGAPLADELARRAKVPAFVVDPVVTDEMIDEARPTGLPEIERRSVFHALNQRAAAREACGRLALDYASARLVVCHMGGGVSAGAHALGRIADVINALDGEGPMGAERTGSLPLIPILELIESGRYSPGELKEMILRRGGLFAHLGVNDLREVERMMDAGVERARLAFSALAYMIAKAAASLLPALEGRPDAFVLTGGMAKSERLAAEITERLEFLAPVVVVPGERETAALAAGAIRVLEGVERPNIYRPFPKK